MSYSTIARSVQDRSFVDRVNASIAQEQKVRGEPISPTELSIPITWAVATASDVEAAYASALAAGNPNPGGDEAVITDGMILSNVQANWPGAPAADATKTKGK